MEPGVVGSSFVPRVPASHGHVPIPSETSRYIFPSKDPGSVIFIPNEDPLGVICVPNETSGVITFVSKCVYTSLGLELPRVPEQ